MSKVWDSPEFKIARLYSKKLIVLHVTCTCGIIVTKNGASIALMACLLLLFISHLSVQEWQKSSNQKLEPFLQEKELLKDDEVVKLGKKDPEAYPSVIYYNLLVINQQWQKIRRSVRVCMKSH